MVRETERVREGQILRHQATNLTERQWQHLSSIPQPTAELWAGHTPFVRREWEREDDARLGGDGKTLPTIIILQQVWHHLYFSPATRQTAASHGSWTAFLLCYYFSFPNICFFSACYIYQNEEWDQFTQNKNRTIFIRMISSSVRDQEIIK